MASNSPLGYPAEYYYPEFIESRPDDPLKPSTHLPLTTSIDNGVGSSARVSTNVTQQSNRTSPKKKPPAKSHTSTSLALNVATDQGLPDADMTKAVKADPTRNLIRDPAEKNIPRLIVDDSILKQTVRTPRVVPTNLGDNLEQTVPIDPASQRETKSLANGHLNGDLTHPSNGYLNGDLPYKTKAHDTKKHQAVKFVQPELPPIDDYWKKEVHINDEGVVSIEPLKYDRNTYEGPYGLTRQGSFVYYITLGIMTLLAGVFIIVTVIFYSLSFPDSSTNTAKLAGAGACALVFYLGLQLILIGLWHQKYRQENPTKVVNKPDKSNASAAQLQSSMETNQAYDYSYQQPTDYSYQQPTDYSYQPPMNYPPYENYSNPPYTSNMDTQMLLQQQGIATGGGYSDSTVWPSNVEIEAQPDSKFMQPMEWTYGPQVVSEIVPVATYPAEPVTEAPLKPAKKHHRRHHHKEKTVPAQPTKVEPDNLFPNSTVTEQALPVLNKAPETTELMKSIADMEKTLQHTPKSSTVSKKHSNRIKPGDDRSEVSSFTTRDKTHRHHSRHRHQRRRRRSRSYSSCSSCSTCSDRSYVDFHSDISYNPHPYYQQKSSDTMHKVITPRTHKTRTPSPPRTYRSSHHDASRPSKTTRDSSITADLEDVPNVRDDRLEQIPVVRRTIIVEPYPAQPSTQITIKPQNDTTGRYPRIDEENETIMYPSTSNTNKKFKKKPKNTESSTTQKEDVNDDMNDKNTSKSQTKKPNQTASNKGVKNAFF